MTFASWLTVGRILLIPFFVIFLAYYEPGNDKYRLIAAGIFLLASVTDALDGFIARHWNQKSSLGSLLDPLADKLLIMAGFLTIFFSAEFPMKPPVWVIIAVVSRDITIVAGLLVLFLSTGEVKIRPNLLGKTTTVFQMATLCSILLLLSFSPILWYITAALTIVSGVFYVIREGKKINGNSTST